MSTLTEIQHDWDTNPRWNGIRRDYTPEDVDRLRGTVRIEYSLAKQGAEKLWRQMHARPYVNALGALTGNQAMQHDPECMDSRDRKKKRGEGRIETVSHPFLEVHNSYQA